MGDQWQQDVVDQWRRGAHGHFACRTHPAGGSRSLSHLIVPTDTPGITFGKPERKMGLNGSHTYAVSIENVTVPAEKCWVAKDRVWVRRWRPWTVAVSPSAP